jgi:hypothetical protein
MRVATKRTRTAVLRERVMPASKSRLDEYVDAVAAERPSMMRMMMMMMVMMTETSSHRSHQIERAKAEKVKRQMKVATSMSLDLQMHEQGQLRGIA